MFKSIDIKSHKGLYTVEFFDNISKLFSSISIKNTHVIIDRKIFSLYLKFFNNKLDKTNFLIIEATEKNKSLEKVPNYIKWLVSNKIRRSHTIVAIGGGIIQDITCYISSTILRGVSWEFVPTTLLAQADSCIGSKSSINCYGIKNILGTFNPPKKVLICNDFLNTLEDIEVKSGIGEMLKVHAIAGPNNFKKIKKIYDNIFEDKNIMSEKIIKSLKIKKKYIEKDEFDTGPRNIFNYGHTFGHAIESATNFKIPHGIAVSIGCDVANFTSMKLNITTKEIFHLMHNTFKKNYQEFTKVKIPRDKFYLAIKNDKKNLNNSTISLVLPDKSGKIFIDSYKINKNLMKIVDNFFDNFSMVKF